ncbi:solute carrier family 12 member 2 isoform X4 [Hydra vulgaris]|uniref:Solute carrier family 12 member 2 isoform X4 n=1 Tax=Hydra vulgaris TaxID=6087 RepID=A0ABM4CWU8_HYDVU
MKCAKNSQSLVNMGMSNRYLKKSDSFIRAVDCSEKDFIDPNTGSEASSVDGSDKHKNIKKLNLERNEIQEFDSFSMDQQTLNHTYSPVRNSTDSGHISSHSRSMLNDFTHDAVPLSVFYKKHLTIDKTQNNTRPTLEQLHKGVGLENAKKRHWDPTKQEELEVLLKNDSRSATKLGWIRGVLIPTLLNIWGVILFLRIPWIVGQAGIAHATAIVLLATFVTTLTTLSMSAICTNGEVLGGGAYYMISRSLGPEFGGSIGVIFSIANAVAVAFYLVGFAETIQSIMERYDVLIIDRKNDIRIVGLIALILCFIITMFGLDWVIHTQVVLMVLIILAILNVVVGSFYSSVTETRKNLLAKGITGLNFKTFKDNMKPDYRDKQDFFKIFSIFFPAVTGIMAGANLSGDLKDPSHSVPVGTLLAILITSFSYLALVWFVGASALRDPTGNKFTESFNETNFNITLPKYGLVYDFQITEKISFWGPLILAGIIAATLSSGLAALVSAPKVFQAVCRDKIFPFIEIFGKGYGRNGEPRYGYILAFGIAVGFIAIGEINSIAPVNSNFFLMAFALVNYSVFQSSLAKSPGWRPSFKYYNLWVSLFAFLMCITIMFLINWWAALVTILFVGLLYKFVDIRKPNINWGTSRSAHTYVKAVRLARRLETFDEHVKNFRVQVLCLTGQPSLRPSLVHFVSHITNHFGLMICGEVRIASTLSLPKSNQVAWLNNNKIKAFHQIVQNESFGGGARCLLQAVGLGKLKPNTLIMGYMHCWQKVDVHRVNEYFQIIDDALELNYGIGIVRFNSPNDTNGLIGENEQNEVVAPNEKNEVVSIKEKNGAIAKKDINGLLKPNETKNVPDILFKNSFEFLNEEKRKLQSPTSISGVVTNLFSPKSKGTIDVWWLYDDGGLTILVPHILSLHSKWKGCKLRIFTPASEVTIEANQIKMATLLKKFRIDFSSVVEFQGINKHPKEKNVNEFKKFRNGQHLPADGNLDVKTLRQIRIGELLHEHSSEAKLIVLTLPIPKRSFVTPLMYMSWLEILTANLPPTLLIRGNQTSVLTVYS